MSQLLPRGFSLSEEKKVARMIAEGQNWQIYSTNCNSYVLAADSDLYEAWDRDYSMASGLFVHDEEHNCFYFAGSSDYLVSSLEKGPFPDDYAQVEAFSIAFKQARDSFADIDLNGSLYIEEYSLFLPTRENRSGADNAMAYGKWLTGGVGVSINSFDRVKTLMSWLSKDALIELSKLAGFDVTCLAQENETHTKNKALTKNDSMQKNTGIEAGERFSLLGRQDLERFFNDNIIDIVLHKDEYERMGIPFPGATILHGPPGCGKTYAVERLAEYLDWPRFDIDSSVIASPYIHDTSKKISEVFRSAVNAAPSILIIDEMEAFLSDRGAAAQSGTHHIEEVAEFLRRIPEAISSGVLVFAMTNMIDTIDPAVLRRGRFDHIIEVTMPGAEEIKALLLSKFKELPVDDTIDADHIAGCLDGHPMSDVAFVLREAGRYAVKQRSQAINQECFDFALDQLPKKKEEKRKIGF